MTQQTSHPNSIYRVSVRTILDEAWVRTLDLHPIATYRHYAGPPRTILMLQFTDQAEMMSLLNQLHNMGLTLLSVELSTAQSMAGDS